MNLNCITGHNDHLYKHMQQSIHTATSIDIIVSFLMESGVRLIQNDLEIIKKKNIPIRILTGNYLNITQPSALYLLKDILGDKIDLRFYNDTKRSFHAKAYIFEKEKENEGEIFIGSSNLSKSAWTSGVEWNYRIDKNANIDDFRYFKNMFEELFYNQSIIVNDFELEKYSKSWKKPKINITPSNEDEEINYVYDEKNNSNVISIFEPRGAQIEALYELKKTRLEGNDRGLVVAATGIGKTYLAAFDSKDFNRVLFVAHREEILKQAYESFKNIRHDKCMRLKDNLEKVADIIDNDGTYKDDKCCKDEYNMGFFMNKTREKNNDIIFASVQSLGKKEYLNENYFSKDYFDYIVIDEFHHAVSSYYQNIINYFKPKFMLGITATPDRLDNKDVFSICDYNTVYEATLKTSIDKGWLVPFRYYGIYDDSINYDDVEYKNGKYNSKELESALSINKRVDLILNHYNKYKTSKALGFCTSKAHAEYMAKCFNENGIPSCAVYSGNKGEYNEERSSAIKKLNKEEIKVIFSVDMFNEGIDIKSIDMVMFLRPTQSPTVFLQQLGRGLRKNKNKNYLNVLDFIGNYKNANLIPYLLKGENVKKEVASKEYIQEENYPQDCIVDFDFRLVDIFDKIKRDNQKIEDRLKQAFFDIKYDLGHTPSRVELFTYMDDDLYSNIKRKSKINPFRNYNEFLDKMDLLDNKDNLIGTIAFDFINFIETTSMSKTYKIPVLLAFFEDSNAKLSINNDDIYKSFKSFYNKGSNKVDMLKDKLTSGFEGWGKKEYVALARKNPIHFLCKTSGEFFYVQEDNFCLNDKLEKYLNNEVFIKNVKDAIEFRTKEYYKNRIDKK